MPPEQYWVLVAAFVLAAAVGWAGAGIYGSRLRRTHASHRARFLEGLRFVLEDKPDRALEVFRGLAEIDADTVETHFALGTLYRRRGEVQRAIQVHQALVARVGLAPRLREAAQLELGRDFYHAGLYDRAEELFQALARDGLEPALALAYLIRIYEHQHDWPQAAQAHERLRAVGVPQQPGAVSHYECELAEAALSVGDLETARTHLRNARRVQRDFGRSAILRGDLARLEGAPELAAQLYRRVVRRDFHLMPLVLPRLAELARERLVPGALHDTIEELVSRGLASPAEIAYAAVSSGHYDDPAVLDCVRAWLDLDSDLKDLAGAFLAPGSEPDGAQLRAIAGALRNVFLRHARYRCSVCGLDSSSFLWHCPGCQSWDTLRAIAALEFLPRAARPRSPGP
jgi:lipopolysaccharide assembly protein B